MNKKLLFSVMSLAALAACTNDDFEGQQQIAEGTSPVQFEVINNSEGMRASMDGNSIVWNANDGDLFTLYHGAVYAAPAATTGYQNATYKSNANEGGTATLTTPSVILPGSAIMVWPVDTTLRIKAADALTIKIPADQEDIANEIPYVSDLIQIQNYAAYTETAPATAYNTAGKDRKYKIYMRPMASQLNLMADYANTDATIAQLYTGGAAQPADGGIKEIEVTSVELSTAAGTTDFTTEIPLQFAVPTAAQGANWGSVANNAWTQVTDFNVAGIVPAGQTTQLTTKYLLADNKGCKFIMLPQANILVANAGAVDDGAVVVNTNYGKVVVATNTNATTPGSYSAGEIADAWYRITSSAVPAATAAIYNETAATTAETTGEFTGKFKTTANVANGMAQVIDAFSGNVATGTSSVVKGEPTGAQGTRYVKVLLNYLNMSDLHIESDKQLRDAAHVWSHMGIASVTVLLDGDATNGEFEISQSTIETINSLNAAAAGRKFTVKPCQVAGEVCNTIVVTGGDEIQNMDFILANGVNTADVVLKAGETWNWAASTVASKKAFKVDATATGIASIINKGTLVSDATATIAIYNNAAVPAQVTTIPFVNEGTWNVTTGKTFVQFDVTNNGTVNISAGAEYRQDGAGNVFTNEATDVPSRFGGDDGQIATVNNSGVFATVNSGTINNYGLIEHVTENAKTYITANQLGGNFNTAFGAANKMGRINLKYSNKDEDNISISAAADQGFVSVTIDGEVTGTLSATAVGTYVNYIIVNDGVTEIAALPAQIKYVEIDDENDTEIAWNLSAPANASYLGLMVLSPVNIKLGTTIQIWDGTTPGTGACYLGADMYVGGTFNNGTAGTLPSWNGYYGNTTANFATKYVTY